MDKKHALLQEFAVRLNHLCDVLGIPPTGKNRQTMLGKRYGVTQNAARKWLVGDGYPDVAKGIQMATDAGISYDWLMTGRGAARVEYVQQPVGSHLASSVGEALPAENTEANDFAAAAINPASLAHALVEAGPAAVAAFLVSLGEQMQKSKDSA